jgi:hypothetical protein
MKNLKEIGGCVAEKIVSFDLLVGSRGVERRETIFRQAQEAAAHQLRHDYLSKHDGDKDCLECAHCKTRMEQHDPMSFEGPKARAYMRCETRGPCVKEIPREVFSYRDMKMTTTTAPLVADVPDHALDATKYAFDAMKDKLVPAKGGYGGLPPQPVVNRDLPATSVDAW